MKALIFLFSLTTLYTQFSGNSAGTTFVRWGKKDCAGSSTLVYEGFAAGQYHDHQGGASEYICLPEEPVYGSNNPGNQLGNWIYGAEYKTDGNLRSDLHDRYVPCAVCYTSNSAQLMIAAKVDCPAGWTEEYEGYLMTGLYSQKAAYNYACVDKEAEAVYDLTARSFGALFYHVQGQCDYLGYRCPPYSHGAELSCVVCTK